MAADVGGRQGRLRRLVYNWTTRIDFDDFTESIPAFAVVSLMAFTFNIAIGICAGFVLYPICKLVAGKADHLKPGLWVLTALSLLFFVFYPYR